MIKMKLICPNCKADLNEVGLTNAQTGVAYYKVWINKKGYAEYELDEFQPDCGENEFKCNNCDGDVRDYLEDKKISL